MVNRAKTLKTLRQRWIQPPRFDDEDVFGLSLGDKPDFGPKFREAFQEYSKKLKSKGWGFVGKGRLRSVFRSPSGDRVIKVSHVPEGVKANLFELFYGRRGNSFVVYRWGQYTEIHIPEVLGHARVGQLSVLCVEWVEKTLDGFALAKQNGRQWIYDVDVDTCPQVGYTKSGRLVAFDWCPF